MHSHELTEAIAAVVLLVSGGVFVAASVWSYRRRDAEPIGQMSALTPGQASAVINRSALVVAAALSLGAAIIHFAAVAPHLEEYAPYAYAFAALGVVQVVLAFGLLRAVPAARTVTVVMSLAVIGVWLLSRTTGLPIAPEPWVPEEVGVADVISTLFEAALIFVLAFATARRTWSGPFARRLAGSIYLLLVPVSGLISVVTLIAVAALGSGSMEHMHG